MAKETTRQSVILWFILGCLWLLVAGSLNIPVEIAYVLFPSNAPVGLVDESEASTRGAISALVYVAGFVPYAIVYARRQKWLKQSESMKLQEVAKSYNEPEVNNNEPTNEEYTDSKIPKTKQSEREENKSKSDSSVKEQLKELKSLYDEKLISKAVYDQKQKDIVDKM